MVAYIRTYLIVPIDITISFNQSVYSVNEHNGPAQAVLVLSNPSSTDITVTVSNTGGSATGEWSHQLYKRND